MHHRLAPLEDVPTLAPMNQQLTEDEQHRNRFQSREWFEQRMRSFLSSEYQAVLCEQDGRPVAYALYRPEGEDSIHLRQIFVARDCRRGGIGRQLIDILRQHYWPRDKRISLGVLVTNTTAIAFYKSVGFHDYAVELEMSPTVACRNRSARK